MEDRKENQEEVRVSKKSLYIALVVLGVLVAGGAGYLMLSDKKPNAPVAQKIDSTTIKKDTTALVKKDSLLSDEEYEGEIGYPEYRVVANSISLPDGQKLKFGDVVYLDYNKSTEADKVIYLNNPDTSPSAKQYPITLGDEMLIDAYQFEDFKNNFSLAPFSQLPASLKKVIMMEKGYQSNGRTYGVTQNAERAKATLSSGDFDGDGLKDIAVILDDNEAQESRIIIISNNKATRKPYVAFAENYNDKLKMRGFKKGASVYMNSTDFVPAPRDGFLIYNEAGSLAIIYDSNAQKFKAYEQLPYSANATAIAE